MATQSKPYTQKNNLAVCYLRVSTKKQKDKGNSIDVQREYANKYCEENNLQIIKYFEETKSASKTQIEEFDYSSNLYDSLKDRPELKEIMKMAKLKKFSHLIIFSRDRLARNFELFVALRFFFEKCGVKIHYTKQGENLLSENERLCKLFELILGSIAELESSLISSRVKSGLVQSIKNKNWVSYHTPYGYVLKSNGSKGKTLKPSNIQKEYVKEIFNLYNNHGYSYKKIAKELNKKDKHGHHWTEDKIERIIKNETYIGYIVWNRRSKTNNKNIIRSPIIEGANIITDQDWHISKKLRYVKSKAKDPKYYNTPFLLRDKLICGHCNTFMKPKNYGKDKYGNERPSVYKCETKDGRQSHFIVKQTIIENIFVEEFSKILNSDIVNNLYNRYCEVINKKLQDVNSQLNDLDGEIHEIKSKLSKLEEMISNETFKDLIEILDTEKRELNNELNILCEFKSKLEYKEDMLNQQIREFCNVGKKEKLIDKIKNSINKFIKVDFPQLETTQKRIIIDMLIDSVIIKKDNSKNGSIESMEIIFKAPINDL
ncbi:hypothetical protein TR13x_03880 [Caloranaerobacter sp. TR13]|uniref:recombinase family protein n=1 Tax=Caloranaerobacter sp. TR13 TaxID=1302151 RepID=UPI0006D4381B|nr:recombinase family protein [Caloranaerobacter sp. TR13]KPU27674.1 hypothetical protein TR13x_03880 [Caloranaerobacter sp. TR13]